jgi:hypothetical protein
MSFGKVRKSKKGDKDVAGDHEFRTSYPMSSQVLEDADPGVISEGEGEDDFTVSMSKTENIYQIYGTKGRRCKHKQDLKGVVWSTLTFQTCSSQHIT